MPRPDPRAPREGQEALIPLERVGEEREGMVLRGRHSDAVDAALQAAQDGGVVTDIDGAAATMLRAAGWALDLHERRGQPYGPAKLLQPVTELLRELNMTPEARKSDADDALAELVKQMGGFDDDSASERGASVHHTPD